MSLFVDTSAFFSYLDSHDAHHESIARLFQAVVNKGDALLTSNYVRLESNALVQRRLGMVAARTLERDVLPQVDTIWVTPEIHDTAVSLLLTADRRGLSLVDCTSFEIMRQNAIQTAATLDADFARQGFTVLPSP